MADLLLLAARELGHGLEYLAHLASRSRGTPCLGFAEELLDGDAKGLCHRDQDVGAREVPAGLPIVDVRWLLPDLPGEFTLMKAPRPHARGGDGIRSVLAAMSES